MSSLKIPMEGNVLKTLDLALYLFILYYYITHEPHIFDTRK